MALILIFGTRLRDLKGYELSSDLLPILICGICFVEPSVSDAVVDNTARQVVIYFSIPFLSNPVGM